MANPSNACLKPVIENWEQLHALLRRYCLSLTQSVWDSDDLMQVTWVKFLERMNEREHNNPEALLLRTAKNTWIDQMRRKKTFDRLLNKKREQAKEEGSAAQNYTTIDIEMAFHCLITHLPPLQRTVLLMRGVFGYSVAETAAKLQTTEGAVKSAYHRARKKLDSVERIVNETTEAPEEELQFRLSALAAAYINGEVDEVLRLVQEDQVDLQVIGSYSASTQTSFNYLSFELTVTQSRGFFYCLLVATYGCRSQLL